MAAKKQAKSARQAGAVDGNSPLTYNYRVPPFERHLFVCCNRRAEDHPRGSCGARGGHSIRAALKALLARHGLKGRVRANECGCLDQCEHGPVVVVYPEQVWYGFVTPDDLAEIVNAHVLRGEPVERLRLPDACINSERCPHRPSATT